MTTSQRRNNTVGNARRKRVGPLVHGLNRDADAISGSLDAAPETGDCFFLVHAELNHTFNPARKHALPLCGKVSGMSYGSRLAEALLIADKSRRELASSIGVSVQAIGQIINSDESMLNAANSAQAARYLRVDHHWLATGEGEARPRPLLSPLAFDLARAFDRVPAEQRDRIYAMAMSLVDFATNVRPATEQPALGATPPQPPRN